MENIENKNTKISCEICPRKCSLAPGQFGFCKTRFNNGEKIISQSNGYSSGFAIDPIEKKPLSELSGVIWVVIFVKITTFPK